jgi:glycosyltransferase involved in cell wall biosynthesis
VRVVHILNDVTDRGNGIVNAAVDLALAQARQGVEVAVVSAGGGYQPLLERAGIAHLTLDQCRKPVRLFGTIRRLQAYLREFQPDVVHAHMRTGLLLAWWCRKSQPFALAGHVHNVHDRESILMGLADRVIAVSASVAATMAAQGIVKRKIRVVLNRTLGSERVPPLAAIEPARMLRPSIVTVCGMNHRKGIEELIAGFEMVADDFPNAHLYLVGDGPDRQQFERQAKTAKACDRIHFECYQPLPQAYLLSADVFVLASRRESFGLVLIEARQAGCAIVATDADGISEALDGGRAGMLVPRKNARALAAGIREMLSDHAIREQWQRNAKEGIDRFYASQMANEVSVVYEELIAASRSSVHFRLAPDGKYGRVDQKDISKTSG